MVDLESLEIRPISKLFLVEFFICEHCECEEAVFYTTPLFEESLRKLDNMHPFNTSFLYHFAKALKRAEELQRKGMELHGKIRKQSFS